MNFLKSFFNDESHIIGLCGFETMRPEYKKQKAEEGEYFYKALLPEKLPVFNFETNSTKNIFLSV